MERRDVYCLFQGRIVQQQRTKVMEYYERKEKQVELQRKIQNSAMLNVARLRILKVQEDHVESVLNEARSRLLTISNKPEEYTSILKNLIVQVVVQLLESEVKIRCRQKDLALVQELIPECLAEARKLSAKDCRINVDNEVFLSDDCAGGVIVYAHDGKICVDSTLETRLEMISRQLIPDFRVALFGANQNRKFMD